MSSEGANNPPDPPEPIVNHVPIALSVANTTIIPNTESIVLPAVPPSA